MIGACLGLPCSPVAAIYGISRTYLNGIKKLRHPETRIRFAYLSVDEQGLMARTTCCPGALLRTGSNRESCVFGWCVPPVACGHPDSELSGHRIPSVARRFMRRRESASRILGENDHSEVAAVVPNGGACSLYDPQAPPLGTAAATSAFLLTEASSNCRKITSAEKTFFSWPHCHVAGRSAAIGHVQRNLFPLPQRFRKCSRVLRLRLGLPLGKALFDGSPPLLMNLHGCGGSSMARTTRCPGGRRPQEARMKRKLRS